MEVGPEDLGKHLRQLRTRRGIGLRELSRGADISPASLSAIENGRSSPTLATLNKILKALGTGFADFFAGAPAADRPPVFHVKNMQIIRDQHRRYVLLFPNQKDLRFEMIHETVEPSETESEWEVHDCDMGGVILQGGPVRLEIRGHGDWPLRRGDAFYVKAGLKHRAINLGARALKQITVWYPPKY